MIIRPRVVVSLTKADLSDAYIEITKPEQMSQEMFQEQVDEFCRYWLGRKWIPDEAPSTDSSQTAKADSGKLDLTLVPPQIIYEIAEIRRFGNEKYHDPNNWKQVEIERYWCACLRHILAAWNDLESIDDESGLKHISHAACNLAFILQKLKEEEKHENTR